MQVRATTPSAPALTLRRAPQAPAGALGTRRRQGSAGRPAAADQLFSGAAVGPGDRGVQSILAKAPALSVVNLQIAAAYRNKKDYDNAIAAYNDLLKADPNSDKARVGIGRPTSRRAISQPPQAR